MTPDPVDALFQVPLGEFTAARNALAKADPTHAAEIKALQKPSAAAWAVNQIHWHRRRVYDALVRAAERMRTANAAILKGKRVDLGPLNDAHRAAVKVALANAREMLAAIGDAATPATTRAVEETLQALPVDGPPGRLTHPVAVVGFDVLQAALEGGVPARPPAEVVAFRRPKDDAAARRAEQKARADAEKEARRREAEAAAREAKRRSLDSRRQQLAKKREAARARLDELTADARAAADALRALDDQIAEIDRNLAES